MAGLRGSCGVNQDMLGSRLLAVALAVGHPLAPFVVGDKCDNDKRDGYEDEGEFHAELSASYDDYGKRAGNHGRSRAWVVSRGRGARAEFGGYEVDAVGGWIVGHGTGAGLRRQRFDGLVVG